MNTQTLLEKIINAFKKGRFVDHDGPGYKSIIGESYYIVSKYRPNTNNCCYWCFDLIHKECGIVYTTIIPYEENIYLEFEQFLDSKKPDIEADRNNKKSREAKLAEQILDSLR
jgi:hypothetical protein